MLDIPRFKPLKFKVKVTRHKHYRVLVFRDLEVMRAFLNEQDESFRVKGKKPHTKKFWDNCDGCCRFWFYERNYKGDRNWIGIICFSRDRLTDEIVAHEMSHAALYWITRMNFPFKLKEGHDERLATLTGLLVGQFWCWYDRTRAKQKKNRTRK